MSTRLWPSGQCPGNDLIEDDSAHTETAAAAPAGNMDSNAVLIKSLVDFVQKLTMDVQSPRQETQALIAVVNTHQQRNMTMHT